MKNTTQKLFFLLCILICLIIPSTCKKLEKSMLVSTGEVTNILTNSADASGMVVDLGGGVTQHGHCYGTNTNPTLSDSKTQLDVPAGIGGFTSQLTNLVAGTKYYIKAYLSNATETVYGKETNFTTAPASVPTLSTTAITLITTTTATSGGNITSDGGASVTDRGVCWNTATVPTTSNSKTTNGTGTGGFISNLTGLTGNTTYYVRAYATNSAGTAYGNEVSFTTSAVIPSLTTTAIGSITTTSATSGGNITIDGGASVTARGVCWNTNPATSPTTADSKTTDGSGTGSFSSSLTGLTAGATYYVRAYATNSAGTAYGNVLSFTTSAVVVPTLSTTAITSITQTTAISGGNITSDGGASVTARGVCWSTVTGPALPTIASTTDGSGSGSFASSLTGLTANTKYYVRAYATNSAGTAYGNEVSFTTSSVTPVVPTLSTTAITSVTQTTASSGGNISSDGGASVTVRGVCWNTATGPTLTNSKTSDATGSGSFSSSLTGLTASTTYYVRAYATNSVGTAYGNEVSFTTNSLTPVLPTLTTTAISSIAQTSASSGGNISSDGGASVTEHGVCWSTTTGPTTANSKTSDGSGIGSFASNLTGLTGNTTYYVRSYATNSVGTAYGNEISFTTNPALSTLTTTAITSITAITASSGGNISNDGGASVTARGVCWNTLSGPTTANSKTSDGSGSGSFASSLTGLTGNTTYYVRAYATSSAGIAYGNEISFTTNTVAIPTLTTTSISAISQTTVTSGGNITSDGGVPVTARGVCWNTATGPTTSNSETTDGTGSGSFISSLTGLIGNTTYYVRAYATNSAGTAYGNEISFTTSPLVPTLTTTAIGSITQTTASSGGNISNDGGGSVTVRGVCWNTSTSPTIANSKTSDGTGSGSFTSSITGLTGNTIYYVRAYATNSAGTAYGNELSFTAGAAVPTLVTTAIGSITATTATSGGNITNDGGASVTARGVCWSTATNPTIADNKTSDGSGSGSFTSNLSGLTPITTYYVRAYATNGAGTAYGNQVTFTTGALLPTISTTTITSITSTTASSGGNITSDGGAAITARGICWSTTTNPTTANNKTSDGSGIGSFSSSLTGLTSNTTYYVRSYAVNSAGTAYGNEVSFTTTIQITDYDGNTYNTVQIGTQLWMQENLKVTHYRNSDAIANITDGTEWANLTSGAYCWYNNDIATYKALYGALYNYFTTIDNRNLCPTGWHVPTDAEWTTLENYLGGSSIAGGKLKESGVTHWTTPNTGADNSSNFTALPGGYRHYNGNYDGFGLNSYWWSSSTWDITYTNGLYRSLSYNDAIINRVGFPNVGGFSIRCLQGEGIVLPAITTDAVSAITYATATCGGNVTSAGGGSVTSRGVCWSITTGPTISNDKTIDGNGTGSFASSLTGLTASTTYYVRSYATNSTGTAYGNELTFTTNAVSLPSLTTTAISGITSATASSGGNITSDGGATVTARGVCWSTGTNPTITDNKTSDGSGTGSFASNISGLTTITIYYVRAYATNSAGTAYGGLIEFTTAALLPTLSTTTITSITSTTANSGGNITSDGGAAITARGVCWNTSTSPIIDNSKTTDGTGAGTFTSSITGLTLGSTYYVRAYATNSAGSAYGNELIFTTLCLAPSAATNSASSVSIVTATLNGTVNANFSSTAVTFDYGTTTGYGTSIAATPGTVTGSGNTAVSAGVISLVPNTQYHYRVKTINCGGTIYGTDQTFTTLCSAPSATSNSATSVSNTTATLNGMVNANNSSTSVTFDYGTTVSYGSSVTASQSPVTGITNTPVSAGVTGLSPNTLYHYRVNAANCGGTIYGTDQTFKTLLAIGDSYQGGIVAYILQPGDPGYMAGETRGLIAAPSDQSTGAAWGCNGTAITGADGTAIGTGTQNTIDIIVGCTTAGIAAKLCSDLVIGGYSDWYLPSKDELNKLYINRVTIGGFAGNIYWSSSEVDIDLTWLQDFNNGIQNYTSKSYATNVRAIRAFPPSVPVLPVLTTTVASSINSTTATSGGNIISDGNATVTVRGVCWSTSSSPIATGSHTTDGTGTGSFTSSITGLTGSTKYYVRAYAINSVGTAYGNELSFTTSLTVTHTAGSVAPVTKTVTYGIVETNLTGVNKFWITKNLGADNQASSATDATETAAGWYWQFNRQQGYKHDGINRTPGPSWINTINENSDWTALNDPCSILLGTGWRIPTSTEWANANDNGGWSGNLNYPYASVLKLHAAGQLYNSSGSLLDRGTFGYYWSSVQYDTEGIYMNLASGGANSSLDILEKAYGLSVRCIRD